jgi:hypothetical protein
MEERESSKADTSATTAGSAPPPESLPFITTSGVLNQLNKNLQELVVPGEEYLEPRFELQKRLPDGSTIPASKSDLSASDLKTKLQQSAKFVAQLTRDDRCKWANQQRLSGNVFFERGEYKAAMDIYLTCLVVKDTEKQHDVDFLSKTLLPVLNNLAQCTLQLGMQKKTMEFCKIALEEISKIDKDKAAVLDPITICRIYFKRAKAQRLTGHYFEARQDLNRSLECLEKKENEADQKVPYQQAIQKEFRHLETAEKEARKNKQQQKRAMQKALSSSNEKSNAHNTQESENTSTAPLSDLAITNRGARQHSTLRARKKGVPVQNLHQETEDQQSSSALSYWQYYCLVVARVAEALLILLGDDETKESLQEHEAEKDR